jgi:predicted glycosyltransferase involved in capsule biosynthesis
MTWETIAGIILIVAILIAPILVYARKSHKPGYGISLLVPFRADNERRAQTWNWLKQYWQHELPGAEIIIGTDDHIPFCKTAAVNRAADKAKGDIFVILDADCYMSGDVIQQCADEIRRERKRGNRLWFMPYRHFYRLTDLASREVLNSNPADPPKFFAASPPPNKLERTSATDIGHWFGALIQVMPREAFFMAGKMDIRFYGWGGEDVAFMHAVDTLYVEHKTMPSGVIHLWHPSIGTSAKDRKWIGQQKPGTNSNLATRYHRAMGDAGIMRDLVDSHKAIEPAIEPIDTPERFYE